MSSTCVVIASLAATAPSLIATAPSLRSAVVLSFHSPVLALNVRGERLVVLVRGLRAYCLRRNEDDFRLGDRGLRDLFGLRRFGGMLSLTRGKK